MEAGIAISVDRKSCVERSLGVPAPGH